MFWNKKSAVAEKKIAAESAKEVARKSLSKGDVPSLVAEHLATKMGVNAAWAWSLKVVSRPRTTDGGGFEVRLFHEPQLVAKGIELKKIKDLNTLLDEHPELVLFDGWVDAESVPQIQKK